MLILYIFIFAAAVSVAFYMLSRSRKLFLFIKPEWLRRNIVTYLIGFFFFIGLGHLLPDFLAILRNFGFPKAVSLFLLIVLLNVTLPYNIVLYFTENKRFRDARPWVLQIIIFSSIVVSTMAANSLLNFWLNASGKFIKYSLAWTFYINGFGALIYLFLRQTDLERKKKLYEKELEVSKLNELKTKAELDALHARINPHFLYNALNSIADLSLVDGKKAREMSLSLADLFRYSINYNDENYATVKEELKIAETYLQIEKIRFDDKLEYHIEADTATLNRKLPRFILQPVIENAVKHGLKNLDATRIAVTIMSAEGSVSIKVHDNGPPFPEEIRSGYGLKSIFDKLELLFPGRFEVRLLNEPVKYFEIILYNV